MNIDKINIGDLVKSSETSLVKFNKAKVSHVQEDEPKYKVLLDIGGVENELVLASTDIVLIVENKKVNHLAIGLTVYTPRGVGSIEAYDDNNRAYMVALEQENVSVMVPAKDVKLTEQSVSALVDILEEEHPTPLQEQDIAEAKLDLINHPPHYTKHPSGVECIEITEHMRFNLGNALKYIWRNEDKNGVEDLRKAIWYLKREIALLQSKTK